MRVRFGYVAMSLELQDGSPNKTTTVKNLMKLPDFDRLAKLRALAQRNLHTQLRLLKHNAYNDVQVFRFTSNLIPLATHDVAKDWRYDEEFSDLFREVGDYVKSHGFRVSFHPDHFVNLHSPREDVAHQSVEILQHHERQCRAMGLDERMKFNIHVGGAYGNKAESMNRFIDRWSQVPPEIRSHLTLENDDKTFTALETLQVSETVQVPMVFDTHHHRCNGGVESDIETFLPQVFNTWAGTGLPPKVHISSPRGDTNANEFRSHADYVAVEDVVPFLQLASKYTNALDVMLEAKAKDLALFRLMQDLQQDPRIHLVNRAAVDV